MLPVTEKLNTLFRPVVEGLGFVYWGAMLGQTESGNTLRLYIDHDDGIDVDHCAEVSRQISALIDVEDPISGAFVLEVSSPGTDRPLFTLEQFEAAVGLDIRLRARIAILGRRNFRGLLDAVVYDSGEACLIIEVDKESYEVPMVDVEKASLVPDYN